MDNHESYQFQRKRSEGHPILSKGRRSKIETLGSLRMRTNWFATNLVKIGRRRQQSCDGWVHCEEEKRSGVGWPDIVAGSFNIEWDGYK